MRVFATYNQRSSYAKEVDTNHRYTMLTPVLLYRMDLIVLRQSPREVSKPTSSQQRFVENCVPTFLVVSCLELNAVYIVVSTRSYRPLHAVPLFPCPSIELNVLCDMLRQWLRTERDYVKLRSHVFQCASLRRKHTTSSFIFDGTGRIGKLGQNYAKKTIFSTPNNKCTTWERKMKFFLHGGASPLPQTPASSALCADNSLSCWWVVVRREFPRHFEG